MLFDFVNDFVCFDKFSYTSQPLPPLQHFHDELKGME